MAVVITTYNRATWLAGAIDSVLQQSRLPEEIIVVDDGSTDHTDKVLATYGDRIRVIRIDNDGTGQTRPLNIGIRASSAELVTLLDSDDRLEAEALATFGECLASSPELGMVSSNWVDEWHDGNGPPRRHANKAVLIKQHPREEIAEDMFLISAQTAYLMLCEGNYLRSCTGLCFPKSVWEAVDGFDESIRTSTDYNFLFRVLRRYPLLYVDRPLRILNKHFENVSGATLKSEYRPSVFEDCIRLIDREIAKAPNDECARLLEYNRSTWLLDLAYHHRAHGEFKQSLQTYVSCLGSRSNRGAALKGLLRLAAGGAFR